MAAWSNERKRRLVQLWNQADPVLSTRLIGTMLDITHNSVISQARRQPECKPRKNPLHPPNPNKPPKRAGKMTLSRPMVRRGTVVADLLTLDEVEADGERDRPHHRTNESYSLPIPVGPYAPARECQWPTSDRRPWTFCGCASVPGRSYCAEHTARAFNAPGVRDVPAEAPEIPGRVAMNARSWA